MATHPTPQPVSRTAWLGLRYSFRAYNRAGMDRCIEQRTTWKTIENFWVGYDRLCTATPLGNSITMVYGTLSTMINKIFKKSIPLNLAQEPLFLSYILVKSRSNSCVVNAKNHNGIQEDSRNTTEANLYVSNDRA